MEAKGAPVVEGKEAIDYRIISTLGELKEFASSHQIAWNVYRELEHYFLTNLIVDSSLPKPEPMPVDDLRERDRDEAVVLSSA